MKFILTERSTLLALLSFLFSFPAYSQKPKIIITENDGREIVDFLASQKLRGRVNFTIEQIQLLNSSVNKICFV
jgi:hypothetical protein